MKLKALQPRLHNIVFHTHTVSGIVISFALFICFYAGALALFMDEMYRWENPEARFETPAQVDYNKVIEAVANYEAAFLPTEEFVVLPPHEHSPYIRFFGRKKVQKGKKEDTERFRVVIHPTTFKIISEEKPRTTMANTLYRLHFFGQIPVVGIYLSGLVAFFFLFAIITGVLVHWKNITQKFYALTTKGKWKQIWTNSHTTLSKLTLPFQFVYAVTGARLGIAIILLLPAAFLLFNGDTNEIIKFIRPEFALKYDKEAPALKQYYTVDELCDKTLAKYPNAEITVFFATNYSKEDGTVTMRFDDKTGVASDGSIIYRCKDASVIKEIIPNQKSYAEGAYGAIVKLHFVTFGGIFLKVVYFILAMVTCYVIMSGVMIWRTARDNERYTEKQKRFHHKVTQAYLAITLSLFPAVAIIFLANKLVPMTVIDRTFYVNTIFFSSWLLLTLVGLFWNSYRILNRNYLLVGSSLGIFIPITNGLVTGDWLWQTFTEGQYYVFSVDFTWLLTSIIGLLVGRYYFGKKHSTINLQLKEEQPSEQVTSYS
ncbi:MAG: PepSY-associated TM helix domain-containing protein [Thermonemataceae bacterium]